MSSYLLPLASGSTGNCTLLCLSGRYVLIDLGISYRTLKKHLQTLGLTPADLDAVLLTHGHGDHVRGLETFCAHESVPVFMTEGTAQRVGNWVSAPVLFGRGREFTPVPGILVRSFPTSHDSPGSVGFVIQGAGIQVGYATDLGICPDSILDRLAGSHAVVLEFNHDVDLLRQGPYPWSLKQRILSDHGHLSNEAAAQAAAWLAAHGTRQFLLAHLSQQNNTPAAALAAAEQALAGTGVSIAVAPVGLGQPMDL